jgi:hypothetical protein
VAVDLRCSLVIRRWKPLVCCGACLVEGCLRVWRQLQWVALGRTLLLLSHLSVEVPVLLEPVSIHPLPLHLHDVDD